MAKRQLTELIQDEAKKIPTPAQDSVIDVTATAVKASEQKEDKEAKISDIQAKTETENIEEEKNSKRTHPTKAELEVTVKELNELLTEASDRQINLQQEIDKLQSTLSEQQAKANGLAKELQEAKTAAIHLADANSQLNAEINALKQEKAQFEQEKAQIALVQQTKQKPAPETYKPVLHHKKSYHAFDRRPIEPLPTRESEEQKENSSPMWLLD
ncbi:hypothetical protein [Calothrix sp. UHCC 0171]|uniref:hypothetical protein n=1 Tax=Calothrix sp. UHCC 0171 TaxID=3110245 RepID=UPI002B2215E2|nr:hypothetical protein [Calothrix sp. UHCC 0171]MEA5569652.1 hypothetical protein [Calothrix sp. UHCC 0171]